MNNKRIIPCLDVKEGRTVKGINFFGLKDAGDPVELALEYDEQGADELVLLDIAANELSQPKTVELVKTISGQISIPFTIGGGIKSLQDVEKMLLAGVSKVSINSAAVINPNLIDEVAKEFGSDVLVLAIDTQYENGINRVFLNGGTKNSGLNAEEWAQETQERGAGEILLTSMDKDGTKNGYDISSLASISTLLHIPVIASGGAGSIQHFVEVFQNTKVDAALAASIFHFGEVEIPVLKEKLKEKGIAIKA